MWNTPSPPTAGADQAADGGFPVDGDLHQMTDDGCPLSPDPARWADPDWRDYPEGQEATAPAPLDSHWQRLRNRAAVRERWRAATGGV